MGCDAEGQLEGLTVTERVAFSDSTSAVRELLKEVVAEAVPLRPPRSKEPVGVPESVRDTDDRREREEAALSVKKVEAEAEAVELLEGGTEADGRAGVPVPEIQADTVPVMVADSVSVRVGACVAEMVPVPEPGPAAGLFLEGELDAEKETLRVPPLERVPWSGGFSVGNGANDSPGSSRPGDAVVTTLSTCVGEPEKDARVEADAEPPMGLAVGKGAGEPITLPAEGVAARAGDAVPLGMTLATPLREAETQMLARGEAVPALEGVPPSWLAVGKGAHDTSGARAAAERVGARAVGDALPPVALSDAVGQREGLGVPLGVELVDFVTARLGDALVESLYEAVRAPLRELDAVAHTLRVAPPPPLLTDAEPVVDWLALAARLGETLGDKLVLTVLDTLRAGVALARGEALSEPLALRLPGLPLPHALPVGVLPEALRDSNALALARSEALPEALREPPSGCAVA